MQRIGGNRRKTRHLYSIPKRDKGKISLTKYLQEFKSGDKVKLLFNSAVSKSPIKPRHFGSIGIVNKKRGECYEIEIKDHKNKKMVIVHPIHLKRL